MLFAFAFFGAVIGFLQFFLLKRIIDFITAGNKSFFLFIFLKLTVYAIAICLMMLLFKDFIMWSGIGLAAGMISGAVINFVIAIKSNDKGDDTA
ncbi:MAG: hypothetical protein II802_02870 [Clostridia bacterium]|nr:hypothetical protein [Clostridia bacterium]